MAAPTFVAIDQDPGGNGAPLGTLAVKWNEVAGEADGDLMLAALYRESTAAYTATPAGWAQVAGFPVDQDTGGFKFRADLWWRRVSGDAGTAAWTWSGTPWSYLEAGLYRGAYAGESPPIATLITEEEAAQNTEPSHPGLTVARTDSALVYVVFNFSDIGSTTPPAGFTNRLVALSNNRNINWYDDLSVAPGATGAITGTTAGDIEWPLTILLELATEAGGAAAQDTPELAGRPFGRRGQAQQAQLLAQ